MIDSKMSLPTPEELIIRKVQEKRAVGQLKTVGTAAHDLDVP